MALSTKAALAALGGALAIGALGVGGVAYAGESGAETPAYVTTVDDGTTSQSYGTGSAADRDCPEGSAGSGGSGSEGPGSGSTAPETTPETPSEGSADGAADA